MNDSITVSVCMITYNHAKYIEQAINSILSQQTNFDFELVIGNDCSTDQSDEIILNIIKNNPLGYKIKYFNHSKNIGMMPNAMHTTNRCIGKYRAICEGDDYWIDDFKLQKQVDFLEQNPEYVFTFHDCELLYDATQTKVLKIGNKKIDVIVNLESVIAQNNIATASILYRKILDYNNLPEWFYTTLKNDYAHLCLLAEKGLGKYLPDVMSVYRIHENGVWSGKNARYQIQCNILFLENLYHYFHDYNIRKAIKNKQKYFLTDEALLLLREGKLLKGIWQLIVNVNFLKKNALQTKPKKVFRAFLTGLSFLIKKSIDSSIKIF